MNGTLEDIRNVTCRFSQPIQNVQEPYADSCNKVIDVLCVLADINAAINSAKQKYAVSSVTVSLLRRLFERRPIPLYEASSDDKLEFS
ncbi:hypothetical protein EMCRGX_G017993 [Ephydatia muelleri]